MGNALKDDKRPAACIESDGAVQPLDPGDILDADEILYGSRYGVEVDNFGQISFGDGEPKRVADALLEQYRQVALQEALKVLVGVKEAFCGDAYVDSEIERVKRMLDFCKSDDGPSSTTIFH